MGMYDTDRNAVSHWQETLKITRMRNPLSPTGDGQVGEIKPAESLDLVTKGTCWEWKFLSVET